MGLRFFEEVDVVFVEEICSLQKICKEKYCVFVFFVLYNNVINVSDLFEIYILEEKFKCVL